MVTVHSQCIMGQTLFPLLWRFISIKYLPFVVKMGKCVSLTSGKLMKDLRPELQPTLNQEQKRSVLFVTRQSIFGAWVTNVQHFWTNFFVWSFWSSSMLPRLVVLRCVVLRFVVFVVLLHRLVLCCDLCLIC